MSWRRAGFALFMGVTAAYLAWRLIATLNPLSPVYSVVFLASEGVGAIAAFVFYAFLTAPRRSDEPPAPPVGLEVDVFIATYNEDPELLRTTAVAARDMEYPHRTWLCDDGRRESVRLLAEELGVGYLTRPRNEHFKAGNLNEALARTTGDLVVTLDADHVPRRAFLMRTLGYFADPSVAFVQTPQVYYNIDSFQHALHARRRLLWHESSVFHHAMQPGAGHYGAAFFVGTGAVLRRSALDEIGGFATGSITEDIHTSMRLHARGHRSVYRDEALGFMLAADTPLAYLVQRLRWAQGSMQLLRWENPVRVRGLSAWQRVGYLNAMGSYLLSYQHVVFYLAPILYLLLGWSPISLELGVGMGWFFAYITFGLVTFRVLAAPHGRLFLAEVFKLVNLSVFVLASLTVLEPQGLRFRVTPKGSHGGLPWSFLVAPLLLLVGSLTATGVGVTGLVGGSASNPGATLLTTAFAAFFSVVAAISLLHTFERRETSDEFAVPVRLEALLDGQPALLERMSLHHAYLRVAASTEPGRAVTLHIVGLELAHAITGQVLATTAARPGSGDVVVKVVLDPLPPAVRDALDRLFFEYALPSFFAEFTDTPPGPPPILFTGLRRVERGKEPILPVRPGVL